MTTTTPVATDFGQFAKLRADAKNQNPETLRKVAQQFEALFMQQMLKSMRDASLGDDLMGGEQGEFYQSMFDQQLAVHLSAGKGLGIAEMMVRQLQGAPASAGHLPPFTGESDAKGVRRDEGISADRKSTATLPPQPSPAPESGGKINGGGRQELTGQRAGFVKDLWPHAEKAAAALGVSPRTLIAQAALETDWGRRMIRQSDGSSSLNYFGIKADKGWDGGRAKSATTEYVNGKSQNDTALFRAYGSAAESFDDYVRFVKDNPRYREALAHGGNDQHYTRGLQRAGYATDPDYAAKIGKVAAGIVSA